MTQAIPTIPRNEWHTHPNFPAQTLLLRSHEGFREISRHLRARAAEATHMDDALQQRRHLFGVETHYLYWQRAMRGHEAYEEGKLYPYLERRFDVSLASLKEEHEDLHRLDRAIRDAFEVLNQASDEARLNPAALQPLDQAMAAYHNDLVEHLREEEDAVIPLLLSLTRDEFNTYYKSPIHVLLRDLEHVGHDSQAKQG